MTKREASYSAHVFGCLQEVSNWESSRGLLTLTNGELYQLKELEPDLSQEFYRKIFALAPSDRDAVMEGRLLAVELIHSEAIPEYAAVHGTRPLDWLVGAKETRMDEWFRGDRALYPYSCAMLDSAVCASEDSENPKAPTLSGIPATGWNAALLRLGQLLPPDRIRVRGVAWFTGMQSEPGWEHPVILCEAECIRTKEQAEQEELSERLDAIAVDKVELAKARKAAAATLKEALKRWWGFSPKGMRVDTAAKIEKAVRMYSIDPSMRSLAKVAKKFGVSRKTVSGWFRQFKDQTDFNVITHRRHEGVKDRLQRERGHEITEHASQETFLDGIEPSDEV